MSLQRKRSRARKRLQTADMSVFTSPPSSVWGTNKNKKTKKRREECDGHAFASLSRRPLWVWWSRLSWFVPNQSDCKEDRERELHIRRRVLTLQPETSVQTPHTHLRPHSYRQCFSTRLLRAIFSPTSVHTGLVSTILARSALTALTRPPVDSEPMFTISTSFLDSFWTCRSGRQSGC